MTNKASSGKIADFANTPIENLAGIGSYYLRKLKRLEIKTANDLIYHFPFRYNDFSQIAKIENLSAGEKMSVQGIVWQIKNLRTKKGKFITKAKIADQSGFVDVIWFNQPYLTRVIKTGIPISLSGKIEIEGSRPKLISPSYEILKNPALNFQMQNLVQKPQTLHTGRIIPIYPETEGLSSKWLRTKIAEVLPKYLKTQKEFLPPEITKRHNLETFQFALSKIHFPKNYKDIEKARKRLAFDELFIIQLAAVLRKANWRKGKKAPPMEIQEAEIESFENKLPFKLTNAQKRAIVQIVSDMQKTIPANRLLEGDVGSGKTVVAAFAALAAFLNHFDTQIAAPTEILAMQHQKTLKKILAPYGVKVGIWTKSQKIKGDITCGTHALLTSFKAKRQVGLVVIDEQHRFGVAQRARLFLEGSFKFTPHLLTMTATPIPRTLALTLYGDLDLSVLDEMPQGRQRISTFVVPNLKRNDAYKFIEKQIQNGRQAFIITPFIEPSETMATIRAAKKEFGQLKGRFSKKVTLGLLHGKLKSREKEEVISKFKKGKIHILLSTPVVEVGIDVPNATVMMIESAERFGLAQLHQLRGRVGRSHHKSYCLLFTDSNAPNSLKRLKSMEKIHVGFELSEIDLKMRGPGEVFGLKQSGFISLKIADLSDHEMISKVQAEAKKLIGKDESLKKYPLLLGKISQFQSKYAQPN